MSSKLALTSTIALPNSQVTMPRLGFGVYQSHGPTCVKSVTTALKAGYRHIDSAQYYQNEGLVDEAVSKSGISRDKLFLTSKQLYPSGDVAGTYKTITNSVKTLGGPSGYVDLFLIHSSSSGKGGRRTLWTALEQAHQEGKARAIGVSNWGVGHIEELKGSKVWPPHVNQIELHPWCQQREVVEYCQKQGIVVQAYCPLVRGEKNKDPTLAGIAQKYGKDPAQILVRWSLQRGFVPLPKSDTPGRIVSNAEVYDFDLSKDDMEKLNGLDQGAKGAIVEAVNNS